MRRKIITQGLALIIAASLNSGCSDFIETQRIKENINNSNLQIFYDKKNEQKYEMRDFKNQNRPQFVIIYDTSDIFSTIFKIESKRRIIYNPSYINKRELEILMDMSRNMLIPVEEMSQEEITKYDRIYFGLSKIENNI